MTAFKRKLPILTVFLLSALLGMVLGVVLASRQHAQLQQHWVTQWLLPELERVVPPYWITPDGVDNFASIDSVYRQGMAYWKPFRVVANITLANLREVGDPVWVAPGDGYLLNFPGSIAQLALAQDSLLEQPRSRLSLASLTAIVVVLLILAMWLLPRPYTARQRAAFAAGLPQVALADASVAELFEEERQLPLLTRLLTNGMDSVDVAVAACRNTAAVRLARSCLDRQWALEDVLALLRDGLAQGSFPAPDGADYAWWQLLTQQHHQSPLVALANSQQPAELVLEPDMASISIRGLTGHLSPKNFAVLVYLARRLQCGQGPLPLPEKAGDPELTQALAAIYADLPRSRDENVFNLDITGEDLNQIRSHINRSIKTLIGDATLSRHYEVQSVGRKKQQVSYTLGCDVRVG